MFHKIVIGADGYSGGADGLCLAEALAAPTAELVLADAYPETPPLNSMALDAYEAVLREDARVVLERRHPGHGLEVRVASLPGGSPERALWDLARCEEADLVVIGSSHRGFRGRRLLGAGVPPCPVAVASHGYRHVFAPPCIVGVALDVSTDSAAALRLAEDLAKSEGAWLDIRVVAESPATEREARKLLVWALEEVDWPVKGDVACGCSEHDAVRSLSHEVDLVVTRRPLAHAGCPLIVAAGSVLSRAASVPTPR